MGVEDAPRTLSKEIGGSQVEALILDGAGKMLVDKVKVKTRYPCPPKVIGKALVNIKDPIRIMNAFRSGFRVVKGDVVTAPMPRGCGRAQVRGTILTRLRSVRLIGRPKCR